MSTVVGSLGAMPVPVSQGGSGASTLTSFGVLVGEGASPINATAAGTIGQVLIAANSANPAFGPVGFNSGLTAHGVILGEGNSNFVATAAGGTNLPLVGQGGGADPVFQATVATMRPSSSQAGTTYTLALGDANTFISTTNATGVTITVPANATVAFPVNTEIDFFQSGAGQLVFAPAATVTLLSTFNELKIAAQYGSASIKQLSANTWALVGMLTA